MGRGREEGVGKEGERREGVVRRERREGGRREVAVNTHTHTHAHTHTHTQVPEGY